MNNSELSEAQANFEQRARAKHGDKYDYSKSVYTKLTDKITINCPDHGDLSMAAYCHLRGQGCTECARTDRLKAKAKDFFARAKVTHDNKYDYSSSVYTGKSNKITIKCPIHGDFTLPAQSHLNGRGCDECLRRKTFIEKAEAVHGDKYDLSETVYNGMRNEVIVRCPEHGEFGLTAHNFLIGFGCLGCGRNKKSSQKLEQFVKSAKMVHGDQYDYSDSVYKDSGNNINIRCPEHGVFKQLPYKHLNGKGCSKCLLKEKRNKELEGVLKKARVIHGDKYDYSKSVYKGLNRKFTIICPKHGEFEKYVSSHLNGKGCPNCEPKQAKKSA